MSWRFLEGNESSQDIPQGRQEASSIGRVVAYFERPRHTEIELHIFHEIRKMLLCQSVCAVGDARQMSIVGASINIEVANAVVLR
jgi:NADH:ubiquinone oxidoreductase subunit F (NADH-binding)